MSTPTDATTVSEGAGEFVSLSSHWDAAQLSMAGPRGDGQELRTNTNRTRVPLLESRMATWALIAISAIAVSICNLAFASSNGLSQVQIPVDAFESIPRAFEDGLG